MKSINFCFVLFCSEWHAIISTQKYESQQGKGKLRGRENGHAVTATSSLAPITWGASLMKSKRPSNVEIERDQ